MDKLKKTEIGELKKIKIEQESLNCSPVPIDKCMPQGPFFNPDYFSHVVVQTLKERDNIPCKLRQDGMVATVVQESYSDYQLQASKTGFGICENNAWVKISDGSKVLEGDKNFIYDQTTPSKEWDIFHNLNKKPSVTVTDSAGTVVEGSVIINDGVRLLIEFNAPFTGTAILN